MVNATTRDEYCTAVFEGTYPDRAPDYSTIGCAFTGIVEKENVIQLRATSTHGGSIDPETVDPDTMLRLGLGATFNGMTHALPKPKPIKHGNPYVQYRPSKHTVKRGQYDVHDPYGYDYDDDWNYLPYSYASAPDKKDKAAAEAATEDEMTDGDEADF